MLLLLSMLLLLVVVVVVVVVVLVLLIMFVIRHDLGENQFLYYSNGFVYPYLSDLI